MFAKDSSIYELSIYQTFQLAQIHECVTTLRHGEFLFLSERISLQLALVVEGPWLSYYGKLCLRVRFKKALQ